MSSSSLSASFWDDVIAQVEGDSDAIVDHIMTLLLADGRVVGDVEVKDPAERAAFYAHLGQTGALDPLAVSSPQIYRQMTSQFERDAAQTMGLK